MPEFIPAADPRLSYFCPQPVDRTGATVRLERFPPSAYAAVRGQIGPTANLRSSSGCAVLFRTDSPSVELHLDALRHHQLVPQGVACEVEGPDGGWTAYSSVDLREVGAAVTVPFATGLERGYDLRTVMLWLPLISTCAIAGITIAQNSEVTPADPVIPRWLAIGDSLTQGFSVQCPTQNWVHRLARHWSMPAWNLGDGGVGMEPGVFDWALDREWELITVGLGSNHAWNEEDAAAAGSRAVQFAEMLLARQPAARLAWLLPPYKPCEDGKGPPDFMGVPLNAETGDRVRRVRESVRAALSPFAPRWRVIGDLAPGDPRYYPDGLHPFAAGFARYAENLRNSLEAAM